jgi:hypothetical protein
LKDVKVYDGAGWQSLKGPPGPSTPSADAGNIITTGSDGLLMLEGETQFSGEWQPQFLGVGNDTSIDTTCAGYWVRSGKLVTLFIGVSNAEATAVKGGSTLLGLPFSIKETMVDYQLSRNPYAGVVISSAGEIIGSLAYADTEEPVMVIPVDDATGGGFSVSFTYLTDDPPLRGSI